MDLKNKKSWSVEIIIVKKHLCFTFKVFTEYMKSCKNESTVILKVNFNQSEKGDAKLAKISYLSLSYSSSLNLKPFYLEFIIMRIWIIKMHVCEHVKNTWT